MEAFIYPKHPNYYVLTIFGYRFTMRDELNIEPVFGPTLVD